MDLGLIWGLGVGCRVNSWIRDGFRVGFGIRGGFRVHFGIRGGL